MKFDPERAISNRELFKTFQPRNSAYDDFEIPTANNLALLTFEHDEFCPARFVTLADEDLVQPFADIGARITFQGPQQIGMANCVSPLRVRTGNAVFIAHAA